jgi:hypothetical protein
MASWRLAIRLAVSFAQVSSSKFLDNFCTDPRFFWFFCGAKKGKAPQKNRAAGKRPLTLAVEWMIRVCAPLCENEPEKGGVHPVGNELRLPSTHRPERRRGDLLTTSSFAAP